MGQPIFDLDAVRQAVVARLPRERRWMVGGLPLRHDFACARERLVPVGEEIDARWFRDEWSSLVIFGELDHADGGGATPLLVIDRRNGAVVGLDLERDVEPLFAISSSLEQFIATFTYLDGFLADGRPVPDDAEHVLRGIDDAFAASDWRLLLEHIRAS
jgi:hypothetical protein